MDEFAYRGVRARFTGIEANGNLRLLGIDGFARAADGSTLDLEWRGDLVRATNTDTGEPLPRIAPARVGATLAYGNGPWTRAPGLRPLRGAAPRAGIGARETDAYTLWNAALTYRMKVQRANLTWYARIDNLTNKLAYSATSILTTTAFPDAPLPGRSLEGGVARDVLRPKGRLYARRGEFIGPRLAAARRPADRRGLRGGPARLDRRQRGARTCRT